MPYTCILLIKLENLQSHSSHPSNIEKELKIYSANQTGTRTHIYAGGLTRLFDILDPSKGDGLIDTAGYCAQIFLKNESLYRL